MKKVEIISLRKNEIKYNVKVKKTTFIPNILLIVGIILCVFLGGNLSSDLRNSLVYVYNPVNSLFSDNSPAVFTSVNAFEKENLSFVVPNKGAKFEISNNGTISFSVVNSIMITAIETGVVESIGITNDGVKYIKILHCLNVVSVIENVDIVGVKVGDLVKKGQDIATAKIDTVVKLRILENDTQLTNLKIEESRILWQN